MSGTEGAPSRVILLECNIDDMTGEALGYALELLPRPAPSMLGFRSYEKEPPAARSLFYRARSARRCATSSCGTTTLGVRCDGARVAGGAARRSTPYGRVRSDQDRRWNTVSQRTVTAPPSPSTTPCPRRGDSRRAQRPSSSAVGTRAQWATRLERPSRRLKRLQVPVARLGAVDARRRVWGGVLFVVFARAAVPPSGPHAHGASG